MLRNSEMTWHRLAEAVSLSIEAAYITADNIEQILAKAAQSARSVSTEADI